MRTPPTSQKAGFRPISFLLSNGVTGTLTSIDLLIRPEELTRSAPSRLSATQTFGGAWVDNFGPGLVGINIAGHTGWRGGLFADGFELFQELKTTVFDQWHSQRQAAVAAGQDPAQIQLIFSDALDGNVDIVVPNVFTLRRNRTRPLLMMYQIGMTVIGEELSQTIAAGVAPDPIDTAALGVASLSDSIGLINGLSPQLAQFFDAAVVAPFQSAFAVASTAVNSVISAIGVGAQGLGAVPAPLLAVAIDIALSNRNALFNYGALSTLGTLGFFQAAQLALAFENIYCVLLNAIQELLDYPNYADLYGSSVCSSTSGGSPLSPLRGENAWSLVFPIPVPPLVAVTPDAQSAMARFRSIDPVLAPISMSEMQSRLASIGSGVNIQ